MKKKLPQKLVHWAWLRKGELVMAGCSRQFGSGGKATARDVGTLRDDWVTLAYLQVGIGKQPNIRQQRSVLALL